MLAYSLRLTLEDLLLVEDLSENFDRKDSDPLGCD
jgi:hypothetical protein